MGKLWCAGCPSVTVETLESSPKDVTFVYPYYMNHAFFGSQIARWKRYPERLLRHLSVVVVDDGSPSKPARDVLAHCQWPGFIRLFRIEVDRRWNWLAARNIGAHHAREGWLLLTDMDHVVPTETLTAIVYGQHDPAVVYTFQRKEHTGVPASPHSASFLMTRQMFWQIGGYDEALSGHYGTDGTYRRELVKHAPIHVLTDALVRHEYQGDSSTTAYLRKQPEDAAVRKLVAKRGKGWRPKTLSFPYHEVTRQQVAA